MQGWMRCLHETRLPRCKQGFQIALDVEEIDSPLRYAPLLFESRAVGDRADSNRLPHPGDLELALAHVGVPQEDSAYLEDAHPRELSVEVGSDVCDEAADQGGTHHRELTRDRVAEPDRIRVRSEVSFPLGIDEGEVDDFQVVGGGELVAEIVQRAPPFGLRPHDRRRNGRTHRYPVEAAHAGNLFDQVFLDLDVEAVGRRRDDESGVTVGTGTRKGESEAREDVGNLAGRYRHADHFLRSRDTHPHWLPLRQLRDGVDGRAGLAAA